MKTTPLLFVIALALSPLGYAQPVKVTIIPVDSVDDLKQWLGKPVDANRAAAAYPGRLSQLPVGRKTQLPILITGLPSPAPQDMRLLADVEIFGTDGRSLGASPGCCQATVAKGSRESAVLLSSTVIVEPESSQAKGSYTVRVSVTDGVHTWTASEVLPYGPGSLPGSASEVPRLRMNLPPGEAQGGGPGDKRDCLSLPTPAEVIRCSEKK